MTYEQHEIAEMLPKLTPESQHWIYEMIRGMLMNQESDREQMKSKIRVVK